MSISDGSASCDFQKQYKALRFFWILPIHRNLDWRSQIQSATPVIESHNIWNAAFARHKVIVSFTSYCVAVTKQRLLDADAVNLVASFPSGADATLNWLTNEVGTEGRGWATIWPWALVRTGYGLGSCGQMQMRGQV